MLTRSPRPSRRVRVAIALRFALLAVGLVAASCTVPEVHQAAAHLGVTLDDTQAQAVADHHNARAALGVSHPDSIDPTTITPEMAGAIAWTAAVAEHERFMNAMRPAGTTANQWRVLLKCEGGGNIRAVNHSGKYRTGFQMDRDFWLSYGGDPAYANPPRWEQAPEAMIYAVAYRGYRSRGWQPWPHCGLKARAAA